MPTLAGQPTGRGTVFKARPMSSTTLVCADLRPHCFIELLAISNDAVPFYSLEHAGAAAAPVFLRWLAIGGLMKCHDWL